MYAQKKSVSSNLKIFLLIIFILFVIGLIFIYSASSVFALEKFGSASYFVRKQLWGALFGLAGLVIAASIPFEKLKKLSPIVLMGSLFLTALTLVPGLAQRIHGSSRWLALNGFGFQPGELLKVAVIMFIAYLADKKNPQKATFIKGYLPILVTLGICSAILLKQPDFGLTVVICATVFVLLFIAQFKMRYLLLTAFCAVPIGIFLIFFKAYRLKRILTFLNPEKDPQGSGYQIIQSLIAIGSGGFWGIGISNSRQKFFYLPMQHTDFIFSIIAEETGLIGSCILISLFMFLLYFGLKIALQLKDSFSSFCALGFVILISMQALINICVAVGIFPTKGMGLPFVSYGNSALVCNLAMIGLIINFVRHNK